MRFRLRALAGKRDECLGILSTIGVRHARQHLRHGRIAEAGDKVVGVALAQQPQGEPGRADDRITPRIHVPPSHRLLPARPRP